MNTHDPWPMAVDRSLVRSPRYHDLFAYRAGVLSADVVKAMLAAAPIRRVASATGAVAGIPLRGVILRDPGPIEQLFGAASLDGFMAAIRQAVADPEVGSIVIDIDSPGGSVEGLPEAAAELRAARDRKPIVAIANGTAASAAYWLASQASEVVVTPSGWAGSIGVYSAHEELSAAYEAGGIKTTLISAGKYKTEGNEFEPLTDDARAHMQAMVDEYYGMFLGDVAKGRSVPLATVRDGYGEGRMLLAKDAKAAGMVDRIATIDDVVRRAMPVRRQAAALAPAIEPLASDEAPSIESQMPAPAPDPVPTPDPLELLRLRARSHAR